MEEGSNAEISMRTRVTITDYFSQFKRFASNLEKDSDSIRTAVNQPLTASLVG